MVQIYAVSENSTSFPIPPVSCRDEDKELQQLLENNLDLLPGGQIRPDDPLKWLLIKREMPVPDPSGGGNRWSVDLMMADQEATPTLVECKRYADTRSRREVIGQMLDYAANGHYYWNKETLWSHAVAMATARGGTLEALLDNLGIAASSAGDYFQRMEDNLRGGQVRLVFFMEHAPYELRSIVEFLNNQMERSEVLIVEAQQFEHDGRRLVIPMLFGYTEQARQVKKLTARYSASRPALDEDTFFAEIDKRLAPDGATAVHKLYEFVLNNRELQVSWGSSSFGVSASHIVRGRKLFNVYRDGRLEFPFGPGIDDATQAQRQQLTRYILPHVDVALSDDMLTRFPMVSIETWGPVIDQIISGLQALLAQDTDEQPPPS